jgi:hypothetical protein
MNREHPGVTPSDLIDRPELAVLQILNSTLEIAKFAIIAAHLELTDADPAAVPSNLEALAADHVLQAADALLRAIASYRSVIKTQACWVQQSSSGLANAPF